MHNVAKEWNLLDKLKQKEIKAAKVSGGKTITNYGKVKVKLQIENLIFYIKVSVIEGKQAYILLAEVDQAWMGIIKDRETQLVTIRGIPISYQDITTDTQKSNLSHRFYNRNLDRTLNLIKQKEKSHGQHIKTDKIIQLDTTN